MTIYKSTPHGLVPMTDEEQAAFESTLGGISAIPQSVTRFQARAALAVAGLFDAVDAIMQSPETPLITRLEWLDKQSFRRDSPTVAWAGERLGLTSDQLDALFVAASEIQI